MPDTIMALERDKDSETFGSVKAIIVSDDGKLLRGSTPLGRWQTVNSEVFITLYYPIDTIRHELATRKAVRAEVRAAEKDKAGTVWPYQLEYDPKTKRFKQTEIKPII